MKTPRRWRLAAIAVVLPVFLLFSGCATHTEHASISATLVGAGAVYSPDTITVQKENKLVIKVSNTTATTHGFSIEGYKIQKTVAPGQSISIKFRAGRGGTFKIYCQLHPAHGTATLVVE